MTVRSIQLRLHLGERGAPHVITTMHDEQRAHSSVRISVGRANDDDQIDEAARRIADAVRQLRAFAL